MSVRRALGYLTSAQQPNGGFVSFSGTSHEPFRRQHMYRTTFVPALMLHALAQVDMPEAHVITKRLSVFVLQQRSEHWSFNYWAKDSKQRESMAYPDDLDDTFCALIGLIAYDTSLVDAPALAKIVKLLIAVEEKPGGPYRTWLVSAKSTAAWLDVDVAVNANIAYFLSRIDSPLPSLEKYLEESIRQNGLESPYYPSAYPLVYYVARALGPRAYPLLGPWLESRQVNGYWRTPMHTALSVLACHYMQSPLALGPAHSYLLGTQQSDGSWLPEAFCIDPNRGGVPHYHGASVLTTAFAVQALATKHAKQPKTSVRKNPFGPSAKKTYIRVVNDVRKDVSILGADVRQHAVEFLDKLLASSNNQEIVLLPYVFHKSLYRPARIKNDVFVQLGLANVYGWTAYTIYDDFLDDEGQPQLLSVANIALRRSVVSFARAVPDTSYLQEVSDTFDAIDAANSWELAHCRFRVHDNTLLIATLPAYGDGLRLADRSLGHALTPLGVLAASGVARTDPAYIGLQTALRHYLVAKQVSDDLHDWEDDLRRGHISYVVATIMTDMALPPGPYVLDGLVPQLQLQFWNYTLPRLCDRVKWHTAMARQTLPKVHKPDGIITHLLDAIDASIDYTRAQQTQAKQFLDTYKEPRG